MPRKSSNFDDFLVATIWADLFEPSGSDDVDLVSRKIVDGLDAYGMIKRYDFEEKEEEGLAA